MSMVGSRRNSPALEPPAGLSQDPALLILSALAFPFGVIKVRALKHALGAGGTLSPMGPCPEH